MPALDKNTALAGQVERKTTPSPAGSTVLDNPIYNSLLTNHSGFALASGQARRFPLDIGPLSGIPDQSTESYADLRTLSGPPNAPSRSPLVLFLDDPPSPPQGWTLLRGGVLDQMVQTSHAERAVNLLPLEAEVRPLSKTDVPAMVELAKLTEPGPFASRTIELGIFFGIFHGCRLVAMAGQRLHLPGFIEVSAVCTHPDVRGRGYAAILMSSVIEHIRAQGKTPILHTFSNNTGAIAVYQRLGFSLRRTFNLAVLGSDL
jgi:GNAT superfamily N-acetyltransferase